MAPLLQRHPLNYCCVRGAVDRTHFIVCCLLDNHRFEVQSTRTEDKIIVKEEDVFPCPDYDIIPKELKDYVSKQNLRVIIKDNKYALFCPDCNNLVETITSKVEKCEVSYADRFITSNKVTVRENTEWICKCKKFLPPDEVWYTQKC